MSNILRPGQVWQIKDSTHLGLVVCVYDDELFGEDVRVLPAFLGKALVPLALENDAVIPPSHNSFYDTLVVMPTNAQSLSRADLALPRGGVSDEALEAVRELELCGIAPGIDARFDSWRGSAVAGTSEAPAIATARAQLFDIWDDIRSRLSQFRHAYMVEIPKSVYGHGHLFRGGGWVTLGGYGWRPVTTAGDAAPSYLGDSEEEAPDDPASADDLYVEVGDLSDSVAARAA